MLWFCSWPERASMLVNATTHARAVELMTSEADGEAPGLVRALPEGGFRAEVVDEDPDDGDTYLELVEGTVVVLNAYEDSTGEAADDACPSECDGPTGAVLCCEKPYGHAGEHSAGDVDWGNA